MSETLPAAADGELALLLELLDHAFEKASWHGPNLLGSFKGVKADDATWAPAGRKSIWEQVLHAAYWKHRVLNKLTATARFPRRGSNWPKPPAAVTQQAWRQDVQLLIDLHRRLRDTVSGLGPGPIEPRTRRLIYGIAYHDIYHAGQIRLLRRLLATNGGNGRSGGNGGGNGGSRGLSLSPRGRRR